MTYAEEPLMTPTKAFQRLMEGNRRYVKGDLLHPNRDEERRMQTAQAQKPFAVVLGCSDSRAPLEILFDQGIGDLFVVRVAGNVVGPIELASIEFSALYLGSSVLLVLGHQNCGAVQAVLEGKTKDIEPVASLIAPAISKEKASLKEAVEANVRYGVRHVKDVPLIADLIKKKKFAVVGGYYDFTSGKVEILTEAP